MIRKLTEFDREQVIKFLSDEPSINLFIIGDIEAFGFDSNIQQLWGQYNHSTLIGVLLRYHESYIPYYNTSTYPENSYDISSFLNIVKAHEGPMVISGKQEIVNRFSLQLKGFTEKSTYFCELMTLEEFIPAEKLLDIKIAVEDDAPRIYDIIAQIEEFSSFGNREDRIRSKIVEKAGRVYYLEEDNKIISVVQTTAENSLSAMIVGVATLKEYRKKGLMSSCLSILCRDLLSEGKSICLFYDNPKAGSVYHRLGFKTIDKWLMLTREL